MTAPLIVPFNDYAGIELSLSGNRPSMSVVLQQRGQWIGSGPVASIPATMIDPEIAALMQLRDRRAGGR
jgi:hypothetical protein